jgi:meso-butanediol dehydrogenase / (S,S)-butanediol dehydrogenase / diacetyl reductase
MVSGRFKERVVFITGAASGIGRATAKHFAAEGAKVFAVDVSSDGLRDTAESIRESGGAAAAGVCDVSDLVSVETTVANAVKLFGGIDVLVNAAGVGGFARLEEIDEPTFQRTVGVNLGGVFHTTKAAMPHLLGRPGANIVNVGSTASLRGQAYASVYSASKAALVLFTRSIALEFATRGVRANCVCPGGVRTPLARFFQLRDDFEPHLLEYARPPSVGTFSEPEDIARVIAFLASEDAKMMNGATLVADHGTLA